MNPTLVEVLRGHLAATGRTRAPCVESAHRGALAIVDADGRLAASLGDIDRPVFPRSAVKLLQALPLVESGAAERLQLTDEELSLACASHNGEPEHLRAARAMLRKAGLDAQALECGAHWPYGEAAARALAAHGEAPNALHNNCSGKHAGFLCVACQLAGSGRDARAYARGYVRPEHPVMREVGAALQSTTGFDLARAPVGTDGCSIPAFAIPLRHLALAFARIGTGSGLPAARARAAERLRRAVANAPFMVGGSGRFDTRLMQRLGERAVVKVGAEGVYCAALPLQGLGVAIKIDDGSTRAAEVAMASVIQTYVALDDADSAFIAGLREPVLRNWNGMEVGALRPAAMLRRLPVARR